MADDWEEFNKEIKHLKKESRGKNLCEEAIRLKWEKRDSNVLKVENVWRAHADHAAAFLWQQWKVMRVDHVNDLCAWSLWSFIAILILLMLPTKSWDNSHSTEFPPCNVLTVACDGCSRTHVGRVQKCKLRACLGEGEFDEMWRAISHLRAPASLGFDCS